MGRRNKESLIEIAIESPWPVSAIIAAGILFFGYVLIPAIFGSNPILKMVAQSIKPLLFWLAVGFALIAVVKWLFSQTRAANRRSLEVVKSGRSSAMRQAPMAGGSHTPNQSFDPQTLRPFPEAQRREPVMATALTAPKISEWSLDLIQSIEWKRFEDLCQRFYASKGIRSECTPLGPDGGIDIRLYQDNSGQATAIVQCKAWGSSFVGVKPIRELLGVMVHEKIGKAFFMTSGKYSDEAKAFAAPNRITLIDGNMLLIMLQRLPEEERAKLLEFATSGDYNIPTCPSCGTKMRLIQGKDGRRDFWGCSNFPRCRQKLGARRGAGIDTAYYQ